MASEPKKRRTVTEDVEKDLLNALMKICTYTDESTITLTPLKIECCNAISSSGTSFSKAFCDTKPYEERLLFGDVFQNGISILREREAPKDRRTQFVFNKLMDVLKGGKHKVGELKITIMSMIIISPKCLRFPALFDPPGKHQNRHHYEKWEFTSSNRRRNSLIGYSYLLVKLNHQIMTN